MPTRTAAQVIGDKGERLVEGLIDDHNLWVARRQTHDFGIDLEAELAQPTENGQSIKGKLIKFQVKTSRVIQRKVDHISFQVERSLLDYADGFRLPVILAVVCLETGTVWWLWLQEWTLLNEARVARNAEARTIAIRIPLDQTLENGLATQLPEIASGSNINAMILALRNIVEAATGWENREIAEGVTRVLGKVHGESRGWVLEKVVDKLLGLGSNPLYWQAQQTLPVLLALVETSGDTFTADQILRLVGRGEAYSRTGLVGLSRLYDLWREEMIELDLTEMFSVAGLGQVAWYTAMRGRYPTSKDGWFGFHILGLEERQLRYGTYYLDLSEEVRDYIIAKWPNRGDSILLDCLVVDEDGDHFGATQADALGYKQAE